MNKKNSLKKELRTKTFLLKLHVLSTDGNIFTISKIDPILNLLFVNDINFS